MNLRDSATGTVMVGGPTETLSVLPDLLGFHPAQSLVAVCLHGPRQRTGLVMRIDLPEPGSGEQSWTSEVVARVAHEQADGALLACYTGEPHDGVVLPRQALIDALLSACAAAGVPVFLAALVRDRRWWSYSCREPGCCPPTGMALPDDVGGPAGQVRAEAALNGRSVLTSRDDLVATVAGPSGVRLDVMREAVAEAERRLRAERRSAGPAAAHARTVAFVRRALAGYGAGSPAIDDADAARICVGVADTDARDEVAALEVSDDAAWLALLIELTRRAPDEVAAPICTVTAWAAYERGDGALANVALDRALAAQPAYSMALMLFDSLQRQIRPEAIRKVSQAVRARIAEDAAAGGDTVADTAG